MTYEERTNAHSPELHAAALETLAAQIDSPDNVPAMCLIDAARFIRHQAARIKELEAARATE